MTHSNETLASLESVGKRYGAICALDDFSLDVQSGQLLAVLGRNGAGKSTAIGLLSGRIAPDRGRARLIGRDPRDIAARRAVGLMLQDCDLPDTLRVAEHVRLFSSYYPNPRPVAETLALAGLEALATRPYGALSGGQKRRVQFALAICGRPRLLFLDEPSVGLDVDARRALWRAVTDLRDAGCGIVLTTHYLEEADALADRVVLIEGGRTLVEDTPAGLKARAAGTRVRARTALSEGQLAQWSECLSVRSVDGCAELLTAAPEALLRRWLAADDTLADLQVSSLSLEEAVQTLTTAASTATGEPAVGRPRRALAEEKVR
ncbi:MAG: ABC transporter ATP-binding protein [Xanthomonadaceae bacterium]|nr:ABC transporter ATP-binding protein [Xanthomonadaceae bacterium]